MTGQIRCHYEVLDVPRDADAATIKKSHRKKALRHHPDKNVGKTEEEQEQSATEFKLIQAAYECLSDPVERKWYDEHRDMILRGGLDGRGGGADGGDGSTFLYDVIPFQYAGCYDGYDDEDPDSFYSVYNEVFEEILQGEKDGYVSEGNIDMDKMTNIHLSEVTFGDSTSDWEDVLAFYNTWEGFTSCLSFAWVDVYHLNDIREAPNRRIRRLMEDDNKKKRKAAKRERVDEVCALVRFVKKRDPRVKIQREKTLREQAMKEVERKKEAVQRKKDIAAAKEEWRVEAERAMAEQEAADLDAGRVRLADLDSDDDYDYGGGGKRGRKKKGKKKGKGKKGGKNNKKNANRNEDGEAEDTTDALDENVTIKDENVAVRGEDGESSAGNEDNSEQINASANTDDANTDINTDSNADEDVCIRVNKIDTASSDEESSEEEEEEEPDSWRCECCRKDFKSQKQFENHERSKKHKETLKKFEKKLKKEAQRRAALEDLMDEIDEEED
eukprot:CAMPEP_0183705796 /NCGR_PEP_ID=MMETSP0737-20130205/2802_1 /TAXON_ID=385413 /ORGANISM="Thalassiosira miniscula, Strain CCMP1093" /LENGTH=499 /DNA_ID=CAMNT_0025933047 /DNA_START=79 /DNA_END=1578 /DNA_ORIENTATION=+